MCVYRVRKPAMIEGGVRKREKTPENDRLRNFCVTQWKKHHAVL